jgi:hypothetical protein
MKAINSLSSGIIEIKGSPTSNFALLCIPGSNIGILIGKKRNASNRFFPSEYIRTAEIIEPIKAKSTAPIKKTSISPGINDGLRFKKRREENNKEINTITKVITP